MKQFSREQQLNSKDKKTLLVWLDSFPKIKYEGLPCISLKLFQDAVLNFTKYLDSGDPIALVQQRGFREKPVDIQEFIESREHKGLMNLWPGVKDNLYQIFEPVKNPYEIILTGSIRSGKSATVQEAFRYIAYLLHMMHNPFFEFGLSPGRPIVLICASVKLGKAMRVLLNPIKNDIDHSKWFRKHCPRNRDINSKIEFGSGIEIVPVSSEDTEALGENVFSAAITEANAMKVIKGSVKLRYSNKEEYHQARELFNKIRERCDATFPTELPSFFGKLFVDSSAEHPEDFAHEKMEEAKKDDRILIINKPIWEVRTDKYPPTDPKFPVEVGDNHRASRVLDKPEDAFQPENILWVPKKLERLFRADTETALKNFAGKVTEIAGAFMPFKDKIERAQSEYSSLTGGRTLFKCEEVSFLEMFGPPHPGEVLDWHELIDYGYFKDCILDNQAPFSLRFDLSATDDATGFAVERINGFLVLDESTILNPRTGQYEQASNVRVPVYVVDGLLRIVAKHGEEINVNRLIQLGLELNRHINIKWATSDRAESSRAVLQEWRKYGMFCDFLSVDTDLRPMMEAKNALREERLLLPPNEIADREFKQLRKTVKNGKARIDHPDSAGASKDCADAIAGATFVLWLKQGFYQSVIPIEGATHRRHRHSVNSTPTSASGLAARQARRQFRVVGA